MKIECKFRIITEKILIFFGLLGTFLKKIRHMTEKHFQYWTTI